MVARLKNLEEVETVDWEPYDHKQAWEITVGLPDLFQCTQAVILKIKQASLYFVDGGKQIRDLIASSGEPWRPLSRFITTDNPHVADRTRAEIQGLVKIKERYRLEYLNSKFELPRSRQIQTSGQLNPCNIQDGTRRATDSLMT